MKLSIARSELFEALSVVSRGMSARSTLPILSGVLLQASGGVLTLQATDLEVSIRRQVAALVEQEGTTVIPGKLLTDIVRSLPEAAVSLELEKDLVHVNCQQSSFTVKTLNPTDFPKFPEIEVDQSIELGSDVLSSMVRKVSRAVSKDETRAILTGILVVVEGKSLKMVATDSYRLALVERTLDKPAGEDLEIVVPGRALDEATKLATAGGSVKIGVSANQVVFELEGTTFVTRRVEGNFPNHSQIIPTEVKTTVVIPADDLASAVKRVSLMALHNTPLKLAVSVEDKTLGLSATTNDVGDASEDLMAQTEGEDVQIAFNHAFLSDGIAGASTDEITIELQSSMKPGLLRSSGEEKYLYLLMPIRMS